MALFGWNKKKNNDSDADLNKKVSNDTPDLSEEMKIIMETKEEEDLESQKKAQAEQDKIDEINRKINEVEEKVSKAIKSDFDIISKSKADGKIVSRASFFLIAIDRPNIGNKDLGNIFIGGSLRGTVKKDQEIYIYNPNHKVIKGVIVDVKPDFYSSVEEASDRDIVLEIRALDGGDVSEINKYAVITDCPPQTNPGPDTPFESPDVLPLILEFDKYSSDKAYFNIVVGAIVHSKFLTPAVVGNGKVGFMALKDNDNEDASLIAAFTDVRNMERGPKELRNGPDGSKLMVLKFKELAKIAISGVNQGFVINPFGPVSFRLSKDHIQQIIKSEAYTKEFGEFDKEPENNGETKVVNQDVPRNAKIMLAVPDEKNAEYKNITDAALKVCKNNVYIQKFGITIKIDEQGNKSYLAIVDCPPMHMQSVYKDIFEGVKGYLSDIKSMEFMLYSAATFADDYFTVNPLIYDNSDGQDI